MEIELCAVSGYTEVGKNMSAIRIDDEVIIIDMGLDVGLIALQEIEGNAKILSTDQLIDLGAVPDDRKIDDWKTKVKAIILGHCHLDHVASVRYLAAKYRAPVIGSPYTIEVLKNMLKEDEVKLPNKFMKLDLDSILEISDNLSVELVSVTHSTLQCAIVVIHTKEGYIVYGNDFKLDNNPLIGTKTNIQRLKEIGDSNKALALIMESMYSTRPGHTPDELEAKEMLERTLLDINTEGKAIFITMFSSHLARIKSAIEIGEKLKRKVVIIGRSMGKYISAGESLGLINFTKRTEVCTLNLYRKKLMYQIDEARGKFLVICTGGQGEPGSVIDKIVNKQLPFTFRERDILIFSCSVIPQQINIANRERLEKILETYKVQIFREIHVSGHSSEEDLRYFIKLIKPKILIPSQGDDIKLKRLVEISEDLGYTLNKNVFLLKNGQRLKLI